MNMKKILLFCLLSFAALSAQAAVDASATYMYSSDYNQVRAGAVLPLGLNAAVGLEGRYVEDKFSEEEGAFQDPVYSVYLPIHLDLDLVKINLIPFYYFKNKSDNPLLQDTSAYGISTQLVMNLRQDEVEELYTQAYIGVSYARQKATLYREDTLSNENYTQMAYTLGLRQNFFGAFTFHVAGTAYQYPNGISDVKDFRGIMDQNDLAFTQSYDISRALGKYVLSTRITRVWPQKRSTLYAGYHYAEFYTADPQHSILVGNSFFVAANASLDVAYNHLQNTDGNNKRDILFVNLNFAF